jgi:hypothetical protein
MIILAGIAALVLLSILIPLEFFLIGNRLAMPAKRNLSRAARGAGLLVFIVVGFSGLRTFGPLATDIAIGAGLVAVLLIAVGVNASRHAGPHDPIETFLWAAAALVCGLAFFYGSLPRALDLFGAWRVIGNAASCAAAAGALTRFMLMLQQEPAGARLPHPSHVAGLPMAGPASPHLAHAALGRRGRAARPKFKT